ncbi:MAG: hypothetical protein ACI85X_000109 [Woeseiaceae bacterium]
MNYKNFYMIILMTFFGGGCAADLTCDEPQKYQAATESNKISSPEGLDQLRQDREMTIGRASPRDPRPVNSPCLDAPPKILSQSSSL